MSSTAITSLNSPAEHLSVLDDQRYLKKMAAFGIWTLPILTFTTPGRPSPSSLAFLDGLAMIKLVVLLIVFFGGLLIIFDFRKRIATTLRPLYPFVAFLAWALLSVLWTPLPAVTMGQAGGLSAQLVLVALIALCASNTMDVESILKTLSKSMLAYSLFILCVHLLAPNFSGLDRRMLVVGNDGVVHPTAAAANSSLGFLLAILCYFVARYRWAGRYVLAGLIIHGGVIYFASSRTALGMAMITVPAVVFLYVDNRNRALAIVAAAVGALTLILVDPSFQLIFDTDSSAAQYLTRGQSADQLQGLSGRTELWQKIWSEYQKSPLIGHGYFVTSEKGEFDAWYMTANFTAHNIYLQILASTGAIGLLLFLAAIIRLAIAFESLFRSDELARMIGSMLVFTAIWYLGWSLLCASFMGPVRSESVFFFTLVGLGIAQVARIRRPNDGEAASTIAVPLSGS